MANSLKRISFEITGFSELAHDLRVLPAAVERRVIERALEYAVQPIVRRAKSLAARKTGALQASIAFVIRKYPGRAVAVVGPSRAYYKNGERTKGGEQNPDRPANYAHLVEFGHATRAKGKPGFRKWTTKEREAANREGRALPQAGLRRVEFVAPRPFLRPAVEQGKAEAINRFSDGVRVGLEKEIKSTYRKNKQIRKKLGRAA